MGLLGGLLFLALAAGVIAFPVLAIIAFVRSNRATEEVEGLERRIKRLEKEVIRRLGEGEKEPEADRGEGEQPAYEPVSAPQPEPLEELKKVKAAAEAKFDKKLKEAKAATQARFDAPKPPPEPAAATPEAGSPEPPTAPSPRA